MANTHSQFTTFLDNVRQKEDKRSTLKTSRRANREKIRKHFRETRNEPVPIFHGQGSYTMHTGTVPLNGDFDIDDGVYLQNIGTDKSQWPTADTVHGWIAEAVKNSTSTPPESRARCVRVRYADDYHVDLPVYGSDSLALTYLFEKGKEPVAADPKGFIDWFQAKCTINPQVRDLVRFLKAWRDYKGGAAKRLKGVSITILVASYAHQSDRYDESMKATVGAIADHLRYGGRIDKPVAPWEDLAADWTEDERKAVVAQLDNLAARGEDAIAEEDLRKAAMIWQKEFGVRFPVPDDEVAKEQRSVLRTSSPALLGSDGRSA